MVFFVVVYAGLRFCQLVLSARGTCWSSQFGVVSDAMGFLVGLVMIPLSLLEHSRSPRPSVLLDVYLLVTIVLVRQRPVKNVVALVRFHQRPASSSPLESVFKAVVLVVESRRKHQLDLRRQQCPEATSGIIGLSTYFWVHSVFLAGFRKLLAVDDLYALDEPMLAEVL
ncbi:hypothetical protein LX32DRAFT_697758 [Colletotrichum zoysiae]|uniref:Uncharacterized protein n=1 Tax=Colletotrichum zoysiae TaxID=1216348 RepID=A0AAD9H927_9PEZI|nr:hypothetical protein LX32DRAFT_697758 [Colletotrichum zoysiae]